MSATAGLILERRRVRRRLAFWRIIAIVAVVVAIIALIPRVAGPISGEHLARIRIDGIIFDDPLRGAALRRLAESPRVKSAPLKAEPSYTTRPDAAALSAERALIEDAYAWFKGLVSERRGLSGAALDEVSEGRVFTGRQAVDPGLIDAAGDEDTARDWLAANRDLAADLEGVDHDWNELSLPWPANLLEQSLRGIMF
ncbi:MAG: S49 family peptidase [Proteobacteria bacterium]|nr:S49 family peptidase [Pseudomonadota bacterium]MCH8952145.1 S49 family peptidase [Pseudomonadota bacterium]